jgi:NADH-quinone oxidoreductase subunit B
MGWLQNKFEKNFMITTVDYVFNWARKSAVWPMTFGLACCAIEMIASSTARFDIARFGSEVFRPSPRQSDLMIVAGTVTLKMAPVVKRIYEQMPDPKWVISMGACSSVGGPVNTYAVLQGVDKIVPTDVYVIGCPPRPENLFYALLKLQDKIDQMSLAKQSNRSPPRPANVENFKRQVMIRANVTAKISSVVARPTWGQPPPAVRPRKARQFAFITLKGLMSDFRKTCSSIRTS